MCGSKYFAGIILIGSLCFLGNLSSASDFGNQLTFDGGFKYYPTDWSPDGRWIAYNQSGEIWIIPSEGGTPINVTADIPEGCTFPRFSFDSKEICFDDFLPGGRVLAKINLETKEYSIICPGIHVAWSHNGRYLAYREIGTSDLYVLDTRDNTRWFLADASIDQELYGANANTTSCFTPDDLYVITTMYDGTKQSLFKIPIKGGEREQLTFSEGYHWYPDCSSDGQWILYTNYSSTADPFSVYYGLEVYNTITNQSFTVFPQLIYWHKDGSFSPDGLKISYNVTIDGFADVYIADFPFTGNEQLIQALEGIRTLISNLDLNKGITNSLIVKLSNAISNIEKRNLKTAMNQLEAFINQVEALRGKKSSAEQADEFIETIRKVIGVLSKQATAAKPNILASRGAKKEILSAGLYFLEQNSPNPFNPSTTISFAVPSVNNEPVLLNIYDIRGSLVRRLVNESKSSGVHSVVWDGKDDSGRKVSAGIYFCHMQAGQFSKTNKMILMK